MKVDEGELLASGAQLAAAPAVLNDTIGDLCRLPRVASSADDRKAVESFFEKIDQDLGTLYKGAIATLAKPSRIGVMHYALGEESISRAILAWGPETHDDIVMMICGRGEGWHVRMTSADSLIETLSSVLLSQVPLSPIDIRCSVTQEAVLVFLAAQQLLRESRLLTLLSHNEPATSFTVEAVESVLDNSGIEDFRWPFLFLDKILPFSANGVSWTETIPSALKELAGRDLVQEVKGTKGATWQLTPSGYRMALAYHHHLTKAGLRVTKLDDQGRKGHEGILLLRSLHDLFLFDLAGKEGAIAALDFEGMRKLVQQLLTPEPAASASAQRSCPACAARIPVNAAFCPECGMTIATDEPAKAASSSPKPPPMPTITPKAEPIAAQAKFCKHCGGELPPGAKFCGGCGHKTA